jgi:hypothetical protein
MKNLKANYFVFLWEDGLTGIGSILYVYYKNSKIKEKIGGIKIMQKMTIHQALSTLKMLDKRVEGATRQKFVATKKKSADKIDGVNHAEFKETMKANLQKVTQLIENRKVLRSAVVLSNAATKITVGGQEYTVAEAIERKANINAEQTLLGYLKAQYQQAVNQVNLENAQLPAKLESYLVSVLGKENRNAEEVKKHTEYFHSLNELELIDPNGLSKEIAVMEKSILDFLNEVDYKLSESNSTTFIEVDYKNI